MELYQPDNLILNAPKFIQYLKQSGRWDIVEEYKDAIDDVDEMPPKHEGALSNVMNAYIRMNEVTANLNLIRNLLPSTSELSNAIDRIADRFETFVQDSATEPFLHATNGDEIEAKASLSEVYPMLHHAYGNFHANMSLLSKDSILNDGLLQLDEPTRAFIQDKILPRIMELDVALSEDFDKLSPDKLRAANDQYEAEPKATVGPKTSENARKPMDVRSVKAATVKSPAGGLVIQLPVKGRNP
ncbi:MAG: hypothetical protein K2X09_05795 [Rickettsiales bacterium]|nr:hypothetical protein [Rickettsiales bacterium]